MNIINNNNHTGVKEGPDNRSGQIHSQNNLIKYVARLSITIPLLISLLHHFIINLTGLNALLLFIA